MATLHELRVERALLSKGISSSTIYQFADRICKDLFLGGDLLDFGAGTANFARHLLKTGYAGTITCADIQPRPDTLPESIRWIESDLNEPLPLPDQSFDFVLAMESITALENPRFLFREFSRLLRPGGTLMVTMPNQESVRSLATLIFDGHFAAIRGGGYPAAITAPLRRDFEYICGETGFSAPRFYYTDLGGIPKLSHILWQQISFGLLRGRLFSDNLAVVTRKA